MIKIEAIPVLQDNYVWIAHDDHHAVLVDPGEADPILAWLLQRNITPKAILVTHHHYDHVGGIFKLLEHYPIPVHGPARGVALAQPVNEGDTLYFDDIELKFNVLMTPGHTLDHVCYLAGEAQKSELHLFCGDTLFSCGCGRLFEGSPAEMYASLTRLAQLPDSTQVCCAHEYTLANIAFALEVEPNNPFLLARHADALALRKQGKASLPISIGTERKTNPFLRCDLESLTVAASQHFKTVLKPGAETFAAIRAWKDEE